MFVATPYDNVAKNDFHILTSDDLDFDQGHSKSNRLLRGCPCNSIKFHEDFISSFCVILLTDRQNSHR